MQKIMFNDKYGLTQAVLEGSKTMTRRMINPSSSDEEYLDRAFELELCEPYIIERYSKYKIGEVVAVAQSYKDCIDKILSSLTYSEDKAAMRLRLQESKGWNNKMFVRAELMPHRIRITGIKVERLQDISDDDCLNECVAKLQQEAPCDGFFIRDELHYGNLCYNTPREAFAALIDKVSGKGTWNSNPYMFVCEFELVK